MSHTLIELVYISFIFTMLGAMLYRGSLHQKVILLLVAVLIGYRASHYQTTRLFSAVQNGELIATTHLLTWGARINATNQQGETPLMIAAKTGQTELVTLLLNRGADPTPRAKNGHTALSYAKAYDHQEIIDLLESPHTQKSTEQKS